MYRHFDDCTDGKLEVIVTLVGDGINSGIGKCYVGLGNGLYRDADIITIGIYNIVRVLVISSFRVCYRSPIWYQLCCRSMYFWWIVSRLLMEILM